MLSRFAINGYWGGNTLKRRGRLVHLVQVKGRHEKGVRDIKIGNHPYFNAARPPRSRQRQGKLSAHSNFTCVAGCLLGFLLRFHSVSALAFSADRVPQMAVVPACGY